MAERQTARKHPLRVIHGPAPLPTLFFGSPPLMCQPRSRSVTDRTFPRLLRDRDRPASDCNLMTPHRARRLTYLGLLLAMVLFSVTPLAAQCLKIQVLDPSSNPVPTATVSIGDQEQTTDGSGVATFCDLGASPYQVIVSAPGFETTEKSVQQTEGLITLVLQLAIVSEDLVVVGTRTEGRDPLESPVPVELVPGERLRRSGQIETGRALQMQAPSFNFSSSSISDGSDALRPATLRGLGPDQTLVLVNGKRRHNSALLHVNTSVGRGTAGTDLNAIPVAAIERIEVLRDGAAAQYGSDAIAGVINIVLKNSPGFSTDTSWGQTYAGDGDAFTQSVHGGFGFKDDGFLNFTFETRLRDRTNRAGLSGTRQYHYIDCASGQAPDNAAGGNCFDPREYTFNRKNFRIGDADSQQYSIYYNAGVPFGENVRFYSFGGFTLRNNNSAGFYRRANQDSRVVLSVYPDGFLPEINTDVNDISVAAGVEWTTDRDWDFDISMNHGRNTFDFLITNSINASYGANSPRMADSGGPRFDQTTFNFDVSRLFEYSGRTMNLAFGGEVRRDSYGIRPGEPLSHLHCTDDPNVDPSTCLPKSAGIQVFPGFQQRVDESRTNIAAYTDLEWLFGGKFLLGTAGRFERYSDFGSTVNGKLSTRYDFTPAFALRGSVNTGFRAPSLHQLYFNNLSTQFLAGPSGELEAFEVGTFRNDSDVAKAVGIPPLKQETSLNFSGGAVAKMGQSTSLTADVFQVRVDDRIVISGNFSASALEATAPQIAAALLSAGASRAQFFTNATQTVTSGVEFSFKSVHAYRNGSVLDFGLAGMYADTKLEGGVNAPALLTGFEDIIFGSVDRSILTEWQPNTRLQALADYSIGRFRFGGALRYFGSYWIQEGSNRQEFSGKWLTDVHFGIRMFDKTELTLGAHNLFDITPDPNKIGQSRGGTLIDAGGRTIVSSPGVFQYSRRAAPFGFNGGFFYVRYSLRF